MRNYAGSAMMLVTTMVAAVGCYTINLKVSGERAQVEALRTQLVIDAREMRNLQAELRTRARFPELQRWNDNVLQMSAPAAGQFLRSPIELASYAAAPAAGKPGLVYAVTTPEAPAPMTTPLVEVAYRATPAADAAPVAAPAARLIRASYSAPAIADRAPIIRAESKPALRADAPRRIAAPRVETAPVAAPAGAPVDLLPPGGN